MATRSLLRFFDRRTKRQLRASLLRSASSGNLKNELDRLEREYPGFISDYAADWECQARDEQLSPEGNWQNWLVLAGRGFGKTRTSMEWAIEKARANEGPGALIAPTSADIRDVLVEGPAGILAISPADFRPEYEPSKRRLSWPNGARATLFSAEEPNRLRGPQHNWICLDEFAAYDDPQAVWDQASFGLRLGKNPQRLITTTPRPIKILRQIMNDPATVVTRGRTRDNLVNLAPSFVQQIEERYAGTRLGRQELDGEILEDVQGAMWSRAILDSAIERGSQIDRTMIKRVVIGVDPQGGGGDEVGIVAAAELTDRRAVILGDYSMSPQSPAQWAARVREVANGWNADAVVCESNYGGDMAKANLETNGVTQRIIMVWASRGKHIRAEPIAGLYETGRVMHVRSFPELEQQFLNMTPQGYAVKGSPDRLDAAVFALTELLFGKVSATAKIVGAR